MRLPFASLSFACALSLLAACGGSSLSRTQGGGGESTSVAPAPRDADEFMAAALHAHLIERDPARTAALMKQVVDRTADRADATWLAIQLCAQLTGCDPQSLEVRFRKLDPQNAAVWIGPLARARAQNDRAVEQQILEEISRAGRFDLYWNSLVARLTIARSRLAPPPPAQTPPADALTVAMNEVMSWISAVAVPSFAALTSACSAERLRDAAVSAQCARLAQVLQRGDTDIAAGVGLGIEERMAPPNSDAARAVAERIRTQRYQRDTSGQIIYSQTLVDAAAMTRELIELMKKLRREQDVSLAVIRWAGRGVTPPAGWTPDVR